MLSGTISAILAQTPAGASKDATASYVFAFLVAILFAVVVYWFIRDISSRRQQQAAQSSFHTAQLRQQESDAKAQAEYHALMLEQTRTQTQLNTILAEKFGKEIALLDVQLELARRDLALRGDQLHFHDTMMEKARIEIESLKLQVREQHKRLDEF